MMNGPGGFFNVVVVEGPAADDFFFLRRAGAGASTAPLLSFSDASVACFSCLASSCLVMVNFKVFYRR